MKCGICGAKVIEPNDGILPEKCSECGAKKFLGEWFERKRPSWSEIKDVNRSEEKLVLERQMLDGKEFSSIMKEDGDRRLWVTYKDGGHFFQVEDLRGVIPILKTTSLGGAIRVFNEM